MYKIIAVLFAMIVSFSAGVGYSSLKEDDSDDFQMAASPQPAATQRAADCPPPDLYAKQTMPAIAMGGSKKLAAEQSEAPKPSEGNILNRDVRNLAELKQYLDNATVDDFNSGFLIDFVEGSPEAFELVTRLYASVEDEDKKSFLAEIISDVSRPEKVTFARELINSSDVEKRRYAYAWLSDSSSDKPGITSALVEASYFEENPEALSELISAISEANMRDNSENLQMTVQRLNELAFHENEYVSSQAISTVSSLTQDSATMNMLMNHLNGSSEELKIAALNGVYYFESPDQELMNTVRQLARDPSASEEIQSIAADLVSTITDQLEQDEVGGN